MLSAPAKQIWTVEDGAQALVGFVRAHGSAAHHYVLSDSLRTGIEAMRNVADALHHIGLLHGRHPGVIGQARARDGNSPVIALIEESALAFVTEREVLTRLTVAAGPLPSTPGHAESEAAAIAQSHAVDTLGSSERKGVAAGATLAIVADWWAIRPILTLAAAKMSVDIPPCTLPSREAIGEGLAQASFTPAEERALRFGAEQIAMQHRAMWDLLEARALARANAF